MALSVYSKLFCLPLGEEVPQEKGPEPQARKSRARAKEPPAKKTLAKKGGSETQIPIKEHQAKQTKEPQTKEPQAEEPQAKGALDLNEDQTAAKVKQAEVKQTKVEPKGEGSEEVVWEWESDVGWTRFQAALCTEILDCFLNKETHPVLEVRRVQGWEKGREGSCSLGMRPIEFGICLN